MKEQLRLSINTPYYKKIETFSHTQKRGFDSSCLKGEIDATHMTHQDILYFNDQNSEMTFKRFHSSQLKSYPTKGNSIFANYVASIAVVLWLVSFVISTPIQAQEKKPPEVEVEKSQQKDSLQVTGGKIIKGTVYESGETLPGTSIILKGTYIGTETDFDGRFTFPKALKSGDI